MKAQSVLQTTIARLLILVAVAVVLIGLASSNQATYAQTTSGSGICSNDKTKSCSADADCGSGNTCYLPIAGGETLSDQVCMGDRTGSGLNCTANDVSVAATHNLVVVDGCDYPGDTATISFVAEFLLTAQDRYDIGVWISQDGGNAQTGTCSVSDFPIAPTPPWTNLDASAQPTDTCGDLTATNNPLFSSIQNIKVQCIDTDGNGLADINTCLSWRQFGANDICTSPFDAFPGTGAKCKCQGLPGITITIPGVIKVDKVTYEADGTTLKPDSTTDFPFTLTGPTSKSFNVKDTDPLYSTGGLPLGTYNLAENVPGGWALIGSTCTSDQAGRTPTADNLVLHNGETVTCTFKNKVAGAAPALAVTKDNDANHDGTFSDPETVPGDAVYPYTVTYKATIVNSSISAATISSITDDKTATLTTADSSKTSCASLVSTTIGANSTVTCYYDVTFNNANTAQVVNTVTVAATNDFGSDSKSDTSTVNFTQSPALTIDKTATPSTYSAVGDVINYSYVVTNSGNVTLNDVSVVDDKATATCPAGAAVMAPGASVTCTASYTIQQSDLDAGKVTNSAFAKSGDTQSLPDSETVNANKNPVLTLDKSVTSQGPYDSVGDVITYSLVATNTGNVSLHGVTISDPKLGTLTCTQPVDLAPGSSLTCTASHTVTLADLDAGSYYNIATADSNETEPVTDDVTVPMTQNPMLALDKSVTSTGPYNAVGQSITYSLVATNNGNVTLHNVSISDSKLGTLTCTQPVDLAPGATLTCTASHTVTQADLDAGSYYNIATADSDETQPVTDDVTVPLIQDFMLALDKSVTSSGPYDSVGDVITYSLVATNTGNVTLHNVSISDPKLGTLTCTQPVDLAPGATLTCTASHTVTLADLDAGSYYNIATAVSDETQPVSDDVTVPMTLNPMLALDKSVTSSGPYDSVGDEITYSLVATNNGNVTLHNVSISDPKLVTLTCTQPVDLVPGATLTCTASHSVTLADLNAGSYYNVATADSNETEPVTDDVTVPMTQNPALALDKSVTSQGPYDSVGEVVAYSLVATNTGNVTLHNVSISDPKLGTLTCTQPVDLAPTETLACTASHAVTLADLDAGSYYNIATADSDETAPVTDDVTVPMTQNPMLAMDKSVTSEGPYDSVGDEITYNLVATNTGNITLHGVTISDPKLGTLTCTQPVDLAPAGTLTCTASHTVTLADLDAGSYYNIATADSDETQPVTDDVTVPMTQNPMLALDKTVTSSGPYDSVGDEITYSLVATNTGNITLHNVSISDPKLGTLTCTQPVNLAPTETLTCTASHAVTLADLDAGSYYNIATADTTETEPVTDDVTVPMTQNPMLALDKTVTSSGPYDSVGDEITYSLVATNTGNITLHNVSISDPKLVTLTCTQPADLAPGATLTCTASHTVTLADLDAGSYYNIATADSTETEPVTDDMTVPMTQNPMLALDKSVTSEGPYDSVGDEITYSLVATNTGNVTLHNVSISDPKLGTLTCTQPVDLAPAGTLTCTASHAVTLADLDAGSYYNIATADSDETLPATDDMTVPMTQLPKLALDKSVTSEGPYDSVGDVIAYSLVATNTGNVTLHNVSISDPKLGTLTCTQPVDLAPTETLTCTASHSVTLGDLDAGSYYNIATADSNETEPVTDDMTVPMTQNPMLALDKTVTSSGPYNAVGQSITYSLVATNTGNITLHLVSISDPKLGTLTCTQPVDLAPGATLTCTASHAVTQADLNTGSYYNIATADSNETEPVTDDMTVPMTQYPAVTLTKTASPTTYKAAGDIISYTLVAKNTGNVTLHDVSISDPKLGTLTCSPSQPAVLAPNATLTCTGKYTIQAADTTVFSMTNTATVNGKGPQDQPVSTTATATVYRQTGALLPTQTTCQMYAAGPSAWPTMYDAFTYQAKANKITSVSPGVIFYYNTIQASSANFVLTVVETNSSNWKPMLIQDLGQAILYNSDCSKVSGSTVNATSTATSTTVTFTVTGATPGSIYYIGIKYSPQNLVGQSVKPNPTSTYYFSTTGYTGSAASIPVKPKK